MGTKSVCIAPALTGKRDYCTLEEFYEELCTLPLTSQTQHTTITLHRTQCDGLYQCTIYTVPDTEDWNVLAFHPTPHSIFTIKDLVLTLEPFVKSHPKASVCVHFDKFMKMIARPVNLVTTFAVVETLFQQSIFNPFRCVERTLEMINDKCTDDSDASIEALVSTIASTNKVPLESIFQVGSRFYLKEKIESKYPGLLLKIDWVTIAFSICKQGWRVCKIDEDSMDRLFGEDPFVTAFEKKSIFVFSRSK